ncbi:efflux RND transporter periplasmic adaptor subunit [Flavobacterium rhizosphaerae]|uniref:Efflux RND transporter periplasmic adaptor subunit n=2 Tax=Flavobacterium TaxID=237 RepID=A0ABW8Z0A9_9FLAO
MRNKTLLGALAALLVFYGCGKKEEQAQQPQGPMPYPVETIIKGDATTFEEYTANLEGQQNVEIRPKVTGFIQKIYVDEGQHVNKGQLLFKLETQTLNQDAAAAKASVDAARVEADRLKPLVDRNIISKVQLETAKANLAQAQAAYNSIAANINYGSIISPVSGVIGSMPFREGALVSSTTQEPLTTVSDSRMMRAYFTMNEKQMLDFTRTFKGGTLQEKIKNTPEVTLLLADGSEYEHKGTLETVNGLVNPTTGTTEFRAVFPNPDAVLRSGGSGIVRIPINHKDVIIVPQNAVMDRQDRHLVFVVENDSVKSRVIDITTTAGKNFIVKDGLKPGDVIVVQGVTKLQEGQKIAPQPVKKEKEPAAQVQDTTAAEQKTNSQQK